MAEIPERVHEEVTIEELILWYNMNEQISKLKGEELKLRNKIYKARFHAPKEGTNSVELQDGALLKATRVINRSVDEAALTTLTPVLRESGKITVEDMFRRKPELIIGAYRKLTDEQRLLLDQVLIIKDGQCQLEIVMPKRKTS
jgi:hypothetical protein